MSVRPRARGRGPRPPSESPAAQPGDAPTGYDRLGLHRPTVERVLGLSRVLYETWFRVEVQGREHVPAEGAAILAANHGGMLPADAVMLWHDLATRGPRLPRAIADVFVPAIPFLWTWASRCGAVEGSDASLAHLLRHGALVLVFPEGAPAIGKPARERHRVRPFRPGHAEHAIRARAPIVPVGLVGPDEQWPEAARLPWFHGFGAPYLPIPATPVPLPVRYHVRYGAPIAPPRDADGEDPVVVRRLVDEVEETVQSLVDTALRDRRGRFL